MKHFKLFFTVLLLLCSTVAIAQKYVVNGIAYNILSEAEKTAEVTFLGNYYSSTPYAGNVVIPDTMYLDYKTYDNISESLSSYNSDFTYESLTMDVNAGDVLTFDYSVSITNSGPVVTISIDGAEILNTSSSTSYSTRYTFPNTGRSTLMISIEKEKTGSAPASVTLKNIKITGTTYKYAVKSIGGDAFKKSTGLKSVVIGNSVTGIGSSAFSGCTGLESVVIGNSVTSIGSSAFSGCTGLTCFEIPNSVTSIGSSAFSGCSNLDEVYISDIAAWCNTSFSSSSANPLYNGAKLFLNGQELNELILPNDVIKISSYAFYGCTNIYSVTIGSSVLTMGVNALPNGLPKVIFLGNTPPRNGEDEIYKPNAKMIYVSNADTYGYGIEYARLSSMFEVDGVKYVPLSTKECEVIDSRYNASAANISVDSVVTYKNRKMTVKNINDYSFYKNNNIKQAYVNNDGYVGDSAFYDCDSIAGDLVVENNGYIGTEAFYDCDNISGYVTVKNNGDIALQAFYDCDAIKGVDISNNGNIEKKAFNSCNAMENAVISNKGYIGEYAFSYCSNLAIAKISNIGYIDDFAFQSSFTQCGDDSRVEISNPSYIGKSAFYGCLKLVTADVFNNGNIGNSAFRNCTSLANLTLGENVDTLGNYAFDNCISLKELSIPDYIPSMGKYCFSNCKGVTKVAVGTGIKSLQEGTFKNCTSLTDMSIGENVEKINDYVFYNCSSLPAINIPQVTKNVADSVFYDCASLSLVVFENRADSIVLGSNGASPMFSSCPLDSVYVGGRLKYTTTSGRGYSPFYGNKYLRSLTYNDVDTAVYAKEYMNCSNLQNVHLGNGIKSIGAEAFRNCTALPRITTPNSVITMGKYVFAGCTSLAKASIGDGTVAINESAFRDCTSLVDVKLGKNIGNIGMSSFLNCSALPEITIPAATTVIADSVFNKCVSLARFYAEDGDKILTMGKNAKNVASGKIGDDCPLFIDCQLDSVYLGRNLSYNQTQEYGYSPFYFNKTLRAVVIGDKVTSVFANEFYQCRKLEYVSVGNGVTSVGNWAFSSCVSLDHFSFGVGLERIGKEAFSDCTLVTKIVSSRNVPPVCGDQALADIDMWECTVYVPEDYIDAYMEAPQWEDFWIEGAEYTITYMVGDEKYSEATIKYGAEIELPVEPVKEGYTFIGWKDILAVMPAYDMTVHAEFKANDYTLTYIVDGEVYETATVAYESEITPIEAPEKDGYTFNRWENLPVTMPAGDIEVIAVYDEIPTEVTITIGKYGSTTYSSAYALDFTNVAGLNAYAATGYNTTTGVITMTRIVTSGEGTGLFLKGEPGTYVVPIIESSDDNSLNMLVGVLKKQIVNAYTDDGRYANYKYTIKSGDAAPKFYQYGDGSSVSAGKAYLQIPVAWFEGMASETVGIRFDEGELTDIDEIEAENVKSKTIYDLQGRAVENPAHGIYIIDGQKVFIK